MSDPTAQEPTMEEILASIRRIISEDDAPPAAEAAAPAHAPAPAPAPAPVAEPTPPPVVHAAPEPEPEEEDDDVLELNEPVPAPAETHGDLDVFDKPAAVEPKPEPKFEPAPVKAPEPAYAPIAEESYDHSPAGGGLVSGHAATAAASHFGSLAQSIAMPAHGRTLEDLVGELLKPLLKDWLDEHLPSMVEQAVRDEVERISRRRVY